MSVSVGACWPALIRETLEGSLPSRSAMSFWRRPAISSRANSWSRSPPLRTSSARVKTSDGIGFLQLGDAAPAGHRSAVGDCKIPPRRRLRYLLLIGGSVVSEPVTGRVVSEPDHLAVVEQPPVPALRRREQSDSARGGLGHVADLLAGCDVPRV